MITIASFCPIISDIPRTEREMIWWVISHTWPHNLILIPVVVGVIYYEIKTRHGNSHYNSRNGFSPKFNRYVGKVAYYGVQIILPAILSFTFGDGIYCMLWPYIVHVVMFFLTKLFLRDVLKFWVY